MAFTERRLAGPTSAGGGTTLYTCPTNQQTTTIIKQIVVSIGSSGGAYTLNLVPYGNSADSSNRLFSNSNLSANDTIIIDLSQVLTSGDFIYATSSADVRITISGIENQGGMVLAGLADSAVTTTKIADRNVTSAKLGQNAFLSNDSTGAIFMMETM